MLERRFCLPAVLVLAVAISPGCVTTTGGSGGEQADLASDVATKATAVASRVGGEDGYGGTAMNGYAEHGPSQMGFHDSGDLAPADQGMMVRLHNESDEDCTFELTYIASHMGLQEQHMEIDVEAGQEETVDLPCSEIVGVGPLEMPGEAGCHLGNGEQVDNTMAVPGFLGLDYECGADYQCTLTPDVDDLDGDGDTEELIVASEAMQQHSMNGGPMGHMHGDGDGMMGHHMGS